MKLKLNFEIGPLGLYINGVIPNSHGICQLRHAHKDMYYGCHTEPFVISRNESIAVWQLHYTIGMCVRKNEGS